MKRSIVLLMMVAFACVMADISVQYAGTTIGASTWNPPNLDESGACTASTGNDYATVSFNVTFPTAGVREIAAMAENDFKDNIQIFVYLGGFPTAVCTGLAHTEDLVNQISYGGGPAIDDFVYFTAATYTFVVTGAVGGIFAVHVNPSDATGQLTGAGPFWSTPTSDTTNDEGACQEYDTSAVDAPFGVYSWTQPTSGFFDIFAIFANNTGEIDYSYITLYLGIPTVAQLSVSPCNTSATFLRSSDSGSRGVYIPYFNLTAGLNYTVVASLDSENYGYWAVQVIPTRVRFFNPTGYIQPERDQTSETPNCSPSDFTAPWGATFFTAEEGVYVIDTATPPEPFTYLDTYSFLYQGLNDANPPTTCSPGLILGGDTGDITPVYAYTVTGENYTVIVSTYSATSPSATSAYVLYFFTGNPIGSIPVITTGNPTTGGTTSNPTGGTTGTPTGGTTGPAATVTTVTTTATQSGSGTVTGAASSVTVSLAALAAAAAFAALL